MFSSCVFIPQPVMYATTVPSTTAQPTPPRVCDENLDYYEPVDVTRKDSDNNSFLGPSDTWKPDKPPNFTSPHEGSHMLVKFKPRTEVTSVTVKNDKGTRVMVYLAFKVKPSDREDFLPLVNPSGQKIFGGFTGDKIPLPESTPYVVEMEVYIVNPESTQGFLVVFNGCEHRGKSF